MKVDMPPPGAARGRYTLRLIGIWIT
jgi:hypothetical protein